MICPECECDENHAPGCTRHPRHAKYWAGYRHGKATAEHYPLVDHEARLRLEVSLSKTTHRAWALGSSVGTGRPPMTLRNRLVIDTMGEEHVSGLLIADEDIREALDLEVNLHKGSGWEVQDFGQMLRCEKRGTVRWVWVRSRPPLEDET